MASVIPYLQLMRPANIVTAVADIMAGFAISGLVSGLFTESNWTMLLMLVIATMGLYGGGIVLNDVFDADIDKLERPERPIPSGKVSIRSAVILAAVLYSIGITMAFGVSSLSGCLAVSIVFFATFYDKYAKHFLIWGPLTMGFCRALNLFLGISAGGITDPALLYIGLIPLFYIMGITLLSRGEVHGAGRYLLNGAGIVFGLVVVLLFGLIMYRGFHIWIALPFLGVFAAAVFFPFRQALRTGLPADLKKAVRAGVLSLILMDAAIGAGFAGPVYGLIIVCLLPASLILSKTFAVT